MDIKASFVTSLAHYGEYPGQGLPEIAVCGKSNVGKSSFLNCLTVRKRLAKVSGTPGKTRLLNIFLLQDSVILVDLPGYGYAEVNKAEQERWGHMMDGYFRDTQTLGRVLHLVDIRHEPTMEDRQMNAFMLSRGIPFTVIATKADKLSRAALGRQIPPICRALSVQPWEVIPFSSETGQGRDRVVEVLFPVVGGVVSG